MTSGLTPKICCLRNIYLFAGIDTAFVYLHRPKVGSVANILQVHAASIFRLKRTGHANVHVYIGFDPRNPQEEGGGGGQLEQ